MIVVTDEMIEDMIKNIKVAVMTVSCVDSTQQWWCEGTSQYYYSSVADVGLVGSRQICTIYYHTYYYVQYVQYVQCIE